MRGPRGGLEGRSGRQTSYLCLRSLCQTIAVTVDDPRIGDLLDYVHDAVGDHLRGVFVTKDDGAGGIDWEIPEIRDDVDTLYHREDYEQMAHEHILSVMEDEYHTEIFDVGPRRFFVEGYRDADLVFLTDSSDGMMTVMIGFDAAHNIELTDFARDCLELL